MKQEGDMIKTVFKASLVVEWRMDWREARSTHEVSLQMAVAVFQPVMPTSALGLMAVGHGGTGRPEKSLEDRVHGNG